MPNMSYCRFNNTRIDLDNCFEAIKEKDIESKIEKDYAKIMLFEMIEFLTDEGILDDYPEDVKERIAELIDKQTIHNM
jgi:uncharacterized protein (DUF433 family)